MEINHSFNPFFDEHFPVVSRDVRQNGDFFALIVALTFIFLNIVPIVWCLFSSSLLSRLYQLFISSRFSDEEFGESKGIKIYHILLFLVSFFNTLIITLGYYELFKQLKTTALLAHGFLLSIVFLFSTTYTFSSKITGIIKTIFFVQCGVLVCVVVGLSVISYFTQLYYALFAMDAFFFVIIIGNSYVNLNYFFEKLGEEQGLRNHKIIFEAKINALAEVQGATLALFLASTFAFAFTVSDYIPPVSYFLGAQIIQGYFLNKYFEIFTKYGKKGLFLNEENGFMESITGEIHDRML